MRVTEVGGAASFKNCKVTMKSSHVSMTSHAFQIKKSGFYQTFFFFFLEDLFFLFFYSLLSSSLEEGERKKNPF